MTTKSKTITQTNKITTNTQGEKCGYPVRFRNTVFYFAKKSKKKKKMKKENVGQKLCHLYNLQFNN